MQEKLSLKVNVDFSGLSLDFIDLTECGCAELDLRLSPTLLLDYDPVTLPILSIPKLASPNSLVSLKRVLLQELFLNVWI